MKGIELRLVVFIPVIIVAAVRGDMEFVEELATSILKLSEHILGLRET
jgi:hypothetical protein